MGKLRILIPDIFGSQSAEAVATSEASASLADGNLLTPEPWQAWRSLTNYPADTCGYVHILGDPLFHLNAVAIAAANLSPGNAEVLFWGLASGGSAPPTPAFAELPFTAVAASSGMTNAIGEVNEGSGATDSAYMTPTTVGSSYVIFDFGTPAANPRTGDRRQCFWIRVRADQDTTGANAYRRPTITASLYENVAGTPTWRADLGTKAVHGTAAHLIFFSWDAINLATADGSNVQLRLDFAKVETSVSPRVDSGWWACESTELSALSGTDSGWRVVLANPPRMNEDLQTATDYSVEDAEPYSRLDYKFEGSVPEQFERLYFYIREDHCPKETDEALNRFLLTPPTGYVQVGKMLGGLWWSPKVNRAQGQFVSVEDPSEKFDDEGGGEWGTREEPRDVFRIVLDNLTASEAAWLKRRLLHQMGTLSEIYVELEPDTTLQGYELGFGGLCTILSASNPIARRNTDIYQYSMEFTVRTKR